MSKSFFTISLLFFLTLNFNLVSAQEAYVEITEEGKILTFYYDNQKSTREGTVYDIKVDEFPGWAGDYFSFNSSPITSAVFDDSFKNYKPTSCKLWFYCLESLRTITNIQNLNTEDVTNMSYMFSNCRYLDNLDLSHFNTANVTSMNCMFQGCNYLTSLDLSNFNTDKVTDMSYMFSGCERLTSLDVSKFNTENVTNMHTMFQSCKKLTSLDLSTFNTSNVTDMGWMFNNCQKLEKLNISSFNTSEVRNTEYMFQGCDRMQTLDLSNFDTDKDTSMKAMFNGCERLKAIFVSDKWKTTSVIHSDNMFNECGRLYGSNGTHCQESDIKYACIDTEKQPGYLSAVGQPLYKIVVPYAVYDATNQVLTFGYGKDLPEGAVEIFNEQEQYEWIGSEITSESNVKKVIFDKSFVDYKPTTCQSWFCYCSELEEIEGISYLNTENVTAMEYMFRNCSKIKKLDLSTFNTDKVTEMREMFASCSSLEELNVSSFNTEHVMSYTYMFFDCSKLTALDISSFVIQDYCGLSYMFRNCLNLKTIYTSEAWPNVKSDAEMFEACYKLVGGNGTVYDNTKITEEYARIDKADAPGYFTLGKSKPTHAYAELSTDKKTLTYHYDNQRSERTGTTTNIVNKTISTADLETVEQVIFDESFKNYQPYSCYGWFENMKNLSSITNIEYINTSVVRRLTNMFYGCSSLTELDLSNFTINCFQSDLTNMFYGCSNLTTIYVSGAWIEESSPWPNENTFYGCEKIVGGNGTTYDESNISSNYARIDTNSDKGYFTKKAMAIYPDLTNLQLTKVYDGTTTISSLTTLPISNELIAKKRKVSIKVVSAKYASAAVADNTKITITVELDGEDKDLFTLSETEYEIEGSITPRIVKPNYDGLRFRPDEKTYRGEINLNLGYTDDVKVNITSAVFNNDETVTLKFELAGTAASNYILTENETVIVITPTPIATVDDQPSTISIYPNPAKASEPITIEIADLQNTNGTIYLYSSNGTLVNQISNAKQHNQITLPSGFYFGVYTTKNQKQTFKVIVR